MVQERSSNGNGSWRNYVIAVLTTALVTICTGWVTLGRDVVRKTELTPFQNSVDKLSENVNSLRTEVAVLNERLKERVK